MHVLQYRAAPELQPWENSPCHQAPVAAILAAAGDVKICCAVHHPVPPELMVQVVPFGLLVCQLPLKTQGTQTAGTDRQPIHSNSEAAVADTPGSSALLQQHPPGAPPSLTAQD